MIERHGRGNGTKEMIGLVRLGRTHGQERLRAAVEEALALGCGDSAAVRHLLSAKGLERLSPLPLEVGELAAFERPLPALGDYDRLLAEPIGGRAR